MSESVSRVTINTELTKQWNDIALLISLLHKGTVLTEIKAHNLQHMLDNIITQLLPTESGDIRRLEELSGDSVQSSGQTSSQQTSLLATTCQRVAASATAPAYIHIEHIS